MIVVGFVDFTRLEGTGCFDDSGVANFCRFSAIPPDFSAWPRGGQPPVDRMTAIGAGKTQDDIESKKSEGTIESDLPTHVSFAR